LQHPQPFAHVRQGLPGGHVSFSGSQPGGHGGTGNPNLMDMLDASSMGDSIVFGNESAQLPWEGTEVCMWVGVYVYVCMYVCVCVSTYAVLLVVIQVHFSLSEYVSGVGS